MDTDAYFVGVDVGTGSARAALVSSKGRVVSKSTKDIKLWTPRHDFYEQSSDDIWSACVAAVNDVLAKADGVVRREQVRGIGFDATCSLVALDENFDPVSVSPTAKDEQNIVVWMDHRAIDEAALINQTGSSVLSFVGGKMSLEMQMPKLLWLKKHMRDTCWTKAKHFFDLPDFLTFKATGDTTRSLCSVVCKWTYINTDDCSSDVAPQKGWDAAFFAKIGLEDLCESNYSRIGSKIAAPGEAVGLGLCKTAADQLGLPPGIAVGASIIDAHAGGIGVLGVSASAHVALEERLALICGTSSCHMAVSGKPIFVPGVWGPYYSAMVPDLWLNEGGQSATGKLIDHIISMHAAFPQLSEMAKSRNVPAPVILNDILAAAAREKGCDLSKLTERLHVLPYFHGNRSPLANPALRGIISGLSLSETLEDLAVVYLAAVQAVAYGSRHIIQVMNEAGHKINTIVICGGLAKNPVFVRQHADITGCNVVLPKEEDSMLVGAAILGACASKQYASVMSAMTHMCGEGTVVAPTASNGIPDYHSRKFAVFRKMHRDFLSYDELMDVN